MIAEPFSSLIVIILLTASTALGFMLRKWLPEEHLSEQSMHAIRLVTGLLVTFVALVLSFELSTVKATFDTAYRDRAQDAAQLARVDQCLRNFGSEGDEARKNIRAYTAAVIASTWPNEEKPEGVEYPDTSTMAQRGENPTLGGLLNQVGLKIKALSPSDKFHENIAAECRSDFAELLTMRWTVIEDAQGAGSSPPLSNIVKLWLMLVFLSFGLQAPRKLLAVIVLAIGVLSISSVMFVIVDLNLPYGGLFSISSSSMRDALADMKR